MRLILSRKGFDSSAGGCPSPLLPGGTLCALPIPDERSRIAYGDLQFRGNSVGDMVADLTAGKLGPHHRAHLDPDLLASAYSREPGWRPLLGQTGSAQGHLANQGVDVGDLFLFFGLFRAADRQAGRWRFVPGSKPFHALWGWLQIGGIHAVDKLSSSELSPAELGWTRYHPHCHGVADPRNTLYLSRDTLEINGKDTGLPGAGAFPRLLDHHRLTAPGARLPTQWQLPAGFFPEEGKTPLSYHGNLERWRLRDGHCHLRCAARGQEFVLDLAGYAGVTNWIQGLFAPACPDAATDNV